MYVRASPERATLVTWLRSHALSGLRGLLATCSQSVALGYRIPAPLGRLTPKVTGIGANPDYPQIPVLAFTRQLKLRQQLRQARRRGLPTLWYDLTECGGAESRRRATWCSCCREFRGCLKTFAGE